MNASHLVPMATSRGQVAHLFDLTIPHGPGRLIRSRCGLVTSDACTPASGDLRGCAKCAAQTHPTHAEYQTHTEVNTSAGRRPISRADLTAGYARVVRDSIGVINKALVEMARLNEVEL